MRNLIGLFWIAAIALAACGPAAGNGDNNGNANGSPNGGTSSFRTADSIEITPGSLELTVDQTEPLEAKVLDAEGEVMTGEMVDWSSSDDAIVEVTDQGVAIAHALGSATVTAKADEASASVEVEVIPPPVASIEVSPAEPDGLRIGRTIRLVVTLYDRQRAPIEEQRPVEFSSSDDTVASVTPEGAVTGESPGSATITVASEGSETTVEITVLPPELQDVELDPRQSELVPGDSTQLSAMLVWADGIAPEVEPSVAWSVDDTDVATIDSTTGELTAVGPGKANVTATVDGEPFDFSDAVEVVFDFGGVSAGGSHACGMVQHAVFCWGANDEGQLGHAAGQPSRVDTDLEFKQVSAGGQHTCAIAADDRVYCWGDGSAGQLGGDTTMGGPVPVLADDTLTFNTIVAGESHTCGITLEDELYCWGDGTDGRLGTGDAGMQTTPTLIGDYKSVTLGEAHTCALTTDDEAHCWGRNEDGQLGLNTSGGPEMQPVTVTGGFSFSAIVAGAAHTCGTTTSGTTACWGANDAGQVGDTTTEPRLTPILVAPNTIARLTAGPMHTCGLTSGGEAQCWGAGGDGRLGTGGASDAREPTDVSTSTTFFTIDAGADFTCAVATSAEVYCWGAGGDGQLGMGTGNANVPGKVTGFATP